MKMNKKPPVLLLMAALFMVFILPAPSYGGRIGRSSINNDKGSVAGQFGVRFISQLPENRKAGDCMEAIVLNPAKLAAHGFAGLKRGDRITFIQGQQADLFQVQQGNKLRQFKIHANGAITDL